jgi:hypothetical protein
VAGCVHVRPFIVAMGGNWASSSHQVVSRVDHVGDDVVDREGWASRSFSCVYLLARDWNTRFQLVDGRAHEMGRKLTYGVK